MDLLAYIPSPSSGEIMLGPIPLRGYAFCIILGVFAAIWIGGRRWVARGGQPGTIADIAVWAVPFGLIGGRLYHVLTDYQLYFGEGRNWVDAFKIWEGGLGIWGAIAFGAVGAWIACRMRGIPLPAYADAVAPGIAVAQALGRWGNWFNQELYGRATDVPWAVRIDNGLDDGTFHPTFLYESLWCLGVAALVIWADRRFRLGHGRAFALYVAAYTVGRFWIEYLRIDEAHEFLGLRLNNWTSLVVFLGAVVYLVVSARRRPGREEIVEPRPDGDEPSAAGEDGAPDRAAAPGAKAAEDTRTAKGSERGEGGKAAKDGRTAPEAATPEAADTKTPTEAATKATGAEAGATKAGGAESAAEPTTAASTSAVKASPADSDPRPSADTDRG
ncbi:prolipoprotein diacylglyceryl transferase [Streptomyces sp. 549]|uniref:prolipoprotein diacylglyceryl transferase n=1 Tax=Streptomyces sp. 549 TaxID=3049076 RepID=UPI0024C2E203|nr:prolipoprotein diacylglyceryl transferase [Streptomyces sp. 549]MDK1474128.1 prolipoprotein diacylglyceryl transferase [Streptomyces sp. 549]